MANDDDVLPVGGGGGGGSTAAAAGATSTVKRAVCIYNYKATMNDELNLKLDDVVVITQCSEDETWLEGTLDGLTGWFPSNYVQIIQQEDNPATATLSAITNDNPQPTNAETIYDDHESVATRIKYLNELKKIEDVFVSEMSRFMNTVVIHLLQSNPEILSPALTHQLSGCIQDLINLHQVFNSKLKEIPENTDAKIGHLMLLVAPQFEQVYSSYAKSNPRFADAINKNNQELVKHLETWTGHQHVNSTIYMTKQLAAPFKHLEAYVKILKEVHRYSEDYHVDRGDVQRSLDFYSDLSTRVYELRKKKEFELDLLSARLSGNIDETGFKKSGDDILLISAVLIIDHEGNKKERVLVLLPHCLVVFVEIKAAAEYEFEYKIPFNHHSGLMQVKKVSNLELNETPNTTTSDSSKYCFELVDGIVLQTSFNINNSTSNIILNSLLISCSTQYDLRLWLDTLSSVLSSNKKTTRNNVVKSGSGSGNGSPIVKQESNLSLNRQVMNNSNGKLNTSSISGVAHNGSFSSSIHPAQSNTTTTNNIKPKTYSFRPHTPLIPHFQLASDNTSQTMNTSLSSSASDAANASNGGSGGGGSTLKRFMYKKPKLSEPSGKYHGADDDLKLLNVIESFCKAKQQQQSTTTTTRQSISVQDVITSAISKSSCLPTTTANAKNGGDSLHDPTGPTTFTHNIQHFVGCHQSNDNNTSSPRHQADLNKLADEKNQLEANIHYLMTELKEHKQSNKELRLLISSLQKQLESERNSRRKLEVFIRKQLKTVNLTAGDDESPPQQHQQQQLLSPIKSNNTTSLNHHHKMINVVEHESSI